MINKNHVKPSQVVDFARTTYRRTAPMAVPHSDESLRIIYRSLNSSKTANLPKQPRPAYLAKPAKTYEVLQYISDSKGEYSKDNYVVCMRTQDENIALDKVKRNLAQGFRSQIRDRGVAAW